MRALEPLRTLKLGEGGRMPWSKLESDREFNDALSRQFGVRSERVQTVILVGHVEQPYSHDAVTAWETIADIDVSLEKVLTWLLTIVPIIPLAVPVGIGLGE